LGQSADESAKLSRSLTVDKTNASRSLDSNGKAG
jgi:hypothetical protein